ncbi:MAG: CBS domain-containing protein [Planctomycetota bacterium]
MQKALEHGYSRDPVYRERADDIVGIFYVKDALKRLHDEAGKADAAPLRSLVRPVLFVPATTGAARLLRRFQSGNQHMAIVLDEYGMPVGLVTVEDVLEEIVGDRVGAGGDDLLADLGGVGGGRWLHAQRQHQHPGRRLDRRDQRVAQQQPEWPQGGQREQQRALRPRLGDARWQRSSEPQHDDGVGRHRRDLAAGTEGLRQRPQAEHPRRRRRQAGDQQVLRVVATDRLGAGLGLGFGQALGGEALPQARRRVGQQSGRGQRAEGAERCRQQGDGEVAG